MAVEDGLPTWINRIADTGCIDTNGSTIVVVDRDCSLPESASESCSRADADYAVPHRADALWIFPLYFIR